MGKIPTHTFETNVIKVIVAVFFVKFDLVWENWSWFLNLSNFFSSTCCQKTHVWCEFSQNIFNGLNARAGHGYTDIR